MYKYFLNTFLILLIFVPFIFAQQPPQLNEYLGSRITFNTGINFIAVKDDYISDERYTGYSPSFLFDWTKINDSSGFHLSFGIINSAKVTNYNVSANIIEATLDLAYVYNIGDLNIFNRKIMFYLGPAPELFFHIRTQDIARGAIMDAYSAAFLFSAGVRLDMIMPLSKKWQFEGNIYSSFLSLGGKLIDFENTNTSMFKILTLFTGLSYNLNLGVRYGLFNNISLKAGYEFGFVRISAWDFFISAKDNFNLSLTYSF